MDGHQSMTMYAGECVKVLGECHKVITDPILKQKIEDLLNS